VSLKSFNKHIIVAGSARSGTSWLAEIIALQFRYRLLFEPEHEFQTENGHLICDKLITENNIISAQEKYFIQIFNNKVDNDWIAQCSNRKYKMHLWSFIPKKYVIKFVRGNLSSVFMNAHFNIPTLFIIRNPYDVIFSQNRVKFPWLYDLSHFMKQDELSLFLKENYSFNWGNFENYTEIQKLTIRWCIENQVVLDKNKAVNDNFKILRYEALKSDINMYYSICEAFNIKPLSNIKEVYNRPSSKTHPKSNIRGVQQKTKRFELRDIKEINKILDNFNVDFYKRQ